MTAIEAKNNNVDSHERQMTKTTNTMIAMGSEEKTKPMRMGLITTKDVLGVGRCRW